MKILCWRKICKINWPVVRWFLRPIVQVFPRRRTRMNQWILPKMNRNFLVILTTCVNLEASFWVLGAFIYLILRRHGMEFFKNVQCLVHQILGNSMVDHLFHRFFLLGQIFRKSEESCSEIDMNLEKAIFLRGFQNLLCDMSTITSSKINNWYGFMWRTKHFSRSIFW